MKHSEGETKLHKGLCYAVVEALSTIFENGKYADKVIEKTLKQDKRWGSRDRKFVAETIYEIVRWKRLLLFISDQENKSIDYWKLLGSWLHYANVSLPEWDEFRTINYYQIKTNLVKAKKIRKIGESIPDWLDELGEKELPDWASQLHALNQQAKVTLRVNTLKTTRLNLVKSLEAQGVSVSVLKEYEDGLELKERQNVFILDEFKNGFFEVQDASSQLVAPFLDIAEGMRIIDACAGAGGKTLHLAALMKNKGKIVAMDREQWKLDELKKRARRAGATTIETRLIDSSKIVKRLAGSADRLLLDVPCSGLGVLRRNPDTKWKLSLDFIAKVKHNQATILSDYSNMLKIGGVLVYSTCSILPDENQNQINRFIKNSNGAFEFSKERIVLPSEGFDGFYMASVKRVK